MPKEIIISSYIGPGYYSKQYIRAMLKNEKSNEVLVKISSLGGDLNHAVDIHDQFAEHGNITVEFNGFNASSATIISLSASKIRISKNSYYLIHKVASWVDEWGYMNDDDLEKLIADLEKEKDENKKITLNVAKMYVAKTGKSVKEILDLMKKETWLTADEALEWGFVDEIYNPQTKVNYLEDTRMVEMISAAGFPTPERKSLKSNKMSDTKTEFPKDENALTAFINKVMGKTPKKKENNEESADDAVDQDKRILELEAKVTVLENEDPKKKVNQEDPEKAKKIADLEAKIANLEDPKKSTAKVEDKSKENNEETDKKETKIAELEAQIETLKNSSVEDPDIVKSGDGGKTTKVDDFSNAVEEAREMAEYFSED